MQPQARSGLSVSGFEFQRRHPRVLLCVPVTLRHLMKGGVRTAHGISLDISEGGVGALVQASLQIGETVAIDVPLPEKTISAVAIVRHISRVSSGFEFVGLSAEERQQILSFAGNT